VRKVLAGQRPIRRDRVGHQAGQKVIWIAVWQGCIPSHC
jgi:hypothetical protein